MNSKIEQIIEEIEEYIENCKYQAFSNTKIIVDKEEYETDSDDFMMLALDAGAEDFNEEDDCYEILTAPDDFSQVREALEQENVPMAQAEMTMIPQTYVELSDENDVKMFHRILDLLDEDDDVQAVYHNVDE